MLGSLSQRACSVSLPASASAASRSACCSLPWHRRSSSPIRRSGSSAPAILSAISCQFCSAATSRGRIGSRRLIVIALIIIGVSMALISRAESFLRGPGAVFRSPVSAAGQRTFRSWGLSPPGSTGRSRGRAAGFVVIGSGFAIIHLRQTHPVREQADRPRGLENELADPCRHCDASSPLSAVFFCRNRPEDMGCHRSAAMRRL